MDVIVERYPAKRDDDLMLCPENGVAYQGDMHHRVAYDNSYLVKCVAYEGNEIASKVNEGRCTLLEQLMPDGGAVLDVGVGSGAFMRAAQAKGFAMCGYDVIPKVVELLKYQQRYSDQVHLFDAVCMWDSIEHMEDPGDFLKRIKHGAYLFLSLPIFDSLNDIRSSKHYRPGEHLYYWTAEGLQKWALNYGLVMLRESKHETEAGRDKIGSFVFVLNSTRQFLQLRRAAS